VRYLADQVVVLYLGQVMERGTAAEVFAPPYHPYTEALLSAIPLAHGATVSAQGAALPRPPRPRIVLQGPVPSVVDPPRGCPFVTRCPHQLGRLCETERPPLQQVTATHSMACHIPLERLRQHSAVL
jgi:peptide/nickel transport system ATP-binding protein